MYCKLVLATAGGLAAAAIATTLLLPASPAVGGTDCGDTTGPEPFNTFGAPPFPPFPPDDFVETMYPFYFGPPIGTATPEMDDRSAISELYPEPTYAGMTGTISGEILGPNGTTPITGVNVIARNVADPFFDAVSAISSDFTDDFSVCCDAVGEYTLTGLTAGATCAVYVDD